MSQLGRITGPLLNANLHRDDIDLKISNTTFDATPVLFFDVGTSTVGIKTDDPNSDFALDVRTDTLTTRLQVDDTAKIDNVLIKAPNTFSTVVGPLHILPTKTAGSYMNFQRMRSDDLEFNDNTISGIISNQTIELDPKDDIAYNNLGLLQENAGKMSSAKNNFKKADKISGYNPEKRVDEIKKDLNEEEENSLGKTALSIFTSKRARKEYFQFIKSLFKKKV